jgi:hypothetical protein
LSRGQAGTSASHHTSALNSPTPTPGRCRDPSRARELITPAPQTRANSEGTGTACGLGLDASGAGAAPPRCRRASTDLSHFGRAPKCSAVEGSCDGKRTKPMITHPREPPGQRREDQPSPAAESVKVHWQTTMVRDAEANALVSVANPPSRTSEMSASSLYPVF